jgi:hypothetical protein
MFGQEGVRGCAILPERFVLLKRLETLHRWQKEFFEDAMAAFPQRGQTNHALEQDRIAYLEKKIQTQG